MVLQLLGRTVHLKDDPSGSLEEHGSGLGKHGLASQPVKKLMAKLLLELYNLMA